MTEKTTTDPTVAGRLRQDILEGVFSPGQRLVEMDLSERYRCGRGAIRVALVQLESESLVERMTNRGAVVHRIPVSEAIEITEARKSLEAFLAGRAARNAANGDKTRLKAIVGEMATAVGAGDPIAYAALNRTLHEEVHRVAAHEVVMELVAKLRNRGVQNQFRLSMMPGRQEASLEQHKAIVDAIVRGDQAGAERAMADHLESVIEVLAHWAET